MNRGYNRRSRTNTKVKGMNAKVLSTRGCVPNAKPKRIRYKKEIEQKEKITLKIHLGNFLIALIIGLFAPFTFGVKLLLVIGLILMAFSEEK